MGEDSRADIEHLVGNSHAWQVRATQEGIAPESAQVVGKIRVLQGTAISKSSVPNGSDTLGDDYTAQAAAISEGALADTFDSLGNNHPCQKAATDESFKNNYRHRFSLDLWRNDQVSRGSSVASGDSDGSTPDFIGQIVYVSGMKR